jgi:hypothetical protein
MTRKIKVETGSGNVFADLGFEAPEEELTKAQLASQVRHIIGGKAPDAGSRGQGHGS